MRLLFIYFYKDFGTFEKGSIIHLSKKYKFTLDKEKSTPNEFYFNNINHIVDQNMFSNVLLRTYVGTMKNYFNKSGCTPDYDTMEMLLVVDTFNDIERSGAGALLEWISPMGPLQLIFSRALDDEPGDDTSSFEFSLGASF